MIAKVIKDWILIFAILAGIGGYFVYAELPLTASVHHLTVSTVGLMQPLLIFGMLFLTFCKVEPRQLKLCRYHWWLLLFQLSVYLAIGAVVTSISHGGLRVVLEGAMICFICPTATAGAVIVKKLGGSSVHITSYTVLINLAVAVIIPVTVPVIHPDSAMSMTTASLMIMGKVFPLLLLPLLAAWTLRRFVPGLHRRIVNYGHLSFHMWVVALALATAVTTRYIVHSDTSIATDLWLVAVSLIACLMQFYVGRKIGTAYFETITAGQSLGQKNTVFAIWLGYTFFTPVTSVVGGFYSIWHNLINSLQLYNAANHPSKANAVAE